MRVWEWVCLWHVWRSGQDLVLELSEDQVDLELTELPSLTYPCRARFWFAPEVTVCNSHPL